MSDKQTAAATATTTISSEVILLSHADAKVSAVRQPRWEQQQKQLLLLCHQPQQK